MRARGYETYENMQTLILPASLLEIKSIYVLTNPQKEINPQQDQDLVHAKFQPTKRNYGPKKKVYYLSKQVQNPVRMWKWRSRRRPEISWIRSGGESSMMKG